MSKEFKIKHGLIVNGGVSGDTISSTNTIYSGGTDLLDIFELKDSEIYLTGQTFTNDILSSTLNNGTTIDTTINTFTEVNTDIIDFNTGYTGNTIVEGRMYWDEENQTVSLGLHNGEVSLQLGQETHYLIKNQSGTTIENGRVVMAAGTLGTSGRILGEYMIADGTVPPKFTLGIATQDIANGDDGYVTEFGLVRGIDTTGSLYGETWNDGDILWVSPTINGGLTNVEPVAPNLNIEMAIVIKAHSNGSIFVRPHRYPYAHDLQDFGWSGGTEANLDVVQWDSNLGYFKLTNEPNFNSLSATTLYGNDAYFGGNSSLACENISLQGDTLISGELVVHAPTTPVLDACHINDSYSFYIDGGELKGKYKDNLGVVSDLVIGGEQLGVCTLINGSVRTEYNDFYTCYNDAVSGDVIEVNQDHTTDCGGIALWSWDKDITINLNGHNLIVTGLGYIGVQANVKIKMTNGTFESVPNNINQAAFNFVGTTGTAYFEGDGAVNVFCYVGGSARGSFRQASTGEVKISGVIMRGSASYCVQGGSGRMYVDNCVMYTDEATNTNAIYGDNVTVTNSTIYGQVFSTSGSYSFSTAGGRSKVRLFKNCNIIPLGTETPIGRRCAIFENCNIEATDNAVRNGIGGEQEYYNCKLERKGTAGTAFQVTNVVGSQCRFYNSEIISTGGGVTSNLPCEFYYTYIKTESGIGINLTTSVFDLNMIIDNCYIDTTGGDCIYTGSINNGLNATITNSTLISRTDNEFCLNAPTGTYFKFSKNIFKNTADSNDVYSRVGLVTENTQVQTTDSYGNIILD